MKKKWSYLIIGMLMFSILFVQKAKVSAAAEPNFKKIEVNETDDIASSESDSENIVVEYLEKQKDGDGKSQVYYYTFTLDKPAFVRFDECANVYQNNFNGDVEIYLSRNKVFTSILDTTWADGSPLKCDLVLDDGKYYMKVLITNESRKEKYYVEEPTNVLAVYAEYLEGRQAGKGTSKKKAITMKNGEEANSQISYFGREKYFKLDVKYTSDIIFQCSNPTKSGWDDYWFSDEVYWKVFTSKGEEVKSVLTNDYDSPLGDKTSRNYITFQLKGLKPDTYYVTVANKGEPRSGKAMYEVQCTPIVLYPPAITEAKRTSQTTAQVTLKQSVKAVTGYEIVYSTKKDLSNAKTKRLSKNTSLSANIKRLKADQTYYARVRSYFVTADGERYYGRYGRLVKF